MRSLWLTVIVVLGTTSAFNQTLNSLRSRAPGSNCRQKPPSQSGHICGVYGSFKEPFEDFYHIAKNQFTTLSICRDLCLHRRDVYDSNTGAESCKAFAHDSVTGNCTLIPFDLTYGDIIINNKKSTTFFEKQCFTCVRGCPQTGTENLLDNGGFELSDNAIGPWDQSSNYDFFGYAKVVSPGHHSSNALLLPGAFDLRQYRDICLNQTYILIFDVKVESKTSIPPKRAPSLSITFPNLLLLPSLIPSDGWQTIFTTFDTLDDGTYNAPPGAQSRYQGFYANGYGSSHGYNTYLDNLEIRLAPATFPITEENLVVNSGFETGYLAPWIVETYQPNNKYQVGTPGLTEGQYSFSSSSHSYARNGFTALLFLHQDIQFQTQPGNRYLLTLDYAVDFESDYISPLIELSVNMGEATWELIITDNQTKHFNQVFTARKPTEQLEVGFKAASDLFFVLKTRLDNVKVRALA